MSSGVTRLVAHPSAATFVPTNLIPPDEVISGSPNDRGYTGFESEDGKVASGVWACDVYKEHILAYPADELFVVIEGTVVVTADGDEPQTFSPGDAFVIQRGTNFTFDVKSPFRKFWMAYEPDAPSDST